MGVPMKRYIEGEGRSQSLLFPESLDDYIAEDNPVRVVEAFVDELDLLGLGFDGMEPESTGRPSYHPATLLKIYIYGYLNRIQSSRRLEREAQRNVELIWLTGNSSRAPIGRPAEHEVPRGSCPTSASSSSLLTNQSMLGPLRALRRCFFGCFT